jgi:hypothetical protein
MMMLSHTVGNKHATDAEDTLRRRHRELLSAPRAVLVEPRATALRHRIISSRLTAPEEE